MPTYISECKSVDDDTSFSSELKSSQGGVESQKFIVGWREWLSFPELGIPGIKAKVDTGARTSCLHTHDYEVFKKEGEEDWVRFHLHPLVRNTRLELTCEALVVDYRQVKDSGGHAEMRPIIRTTGRIGTFEWRFEASLTNRESMKFRMLLGRTALKGLFVVDSQASYVMGKSLFKTYPKGV